MVKRLDTCGVFSCGFLVWIQIDLVNRMFDSGLVFPLTHQVGLDRDVPSQHGSRPSEVIRVVSPMACFLPFLCQTLLPHTVHLLIFVVMQANDT